MAVSRDAIERALWEDRRAAEAHGPGAWDVADVMAVLDRLGLTN